MARSTRSSRAKASNAISLDLSKVEGRVNFKEGDHLLEVLEVTKEEGSKAPYLNWKMQAVEGDSEGAIVYNNTSLSEQSLWNLRTKLEALGVEIPDSEFDLDLDDLVGLTLMGTIELETYEGKKRPRLADFWAADEAEPEPEPKKTRARRGAKAEEPEEKPARARRGAKAAAKEEPALLSQDDINDMSEEELADLIEEHDLDVELDDFKTLRKQRAAVIDAAQEADLLEEEGAEEPEPEPEEKPARRRRGAAAEPEEAEEKPARRRRAR